MLSKAGARDDVQGIVKARGEYWRRSRQALAPTFSARKIKVVGVIMVTIMHGVTIYGD